MLMERQLDVHFSIRQMSTQEWVQSVVNFLLFDIFIVFFIIGSFKTSLDQELLGYNLSIYTSLKSLPIFCLVQIESCRLYIFMSTKNPDSTKIISKIVSSSDRDSTR